MYKRNKRKPNDVAKQTHEHDVEVAYWRKCNQIHAWFEDNLDDVVDNCAYTPVYKEDLEKLKRDCQEVLDNRDKAEDILPTRGGFFYGSTEYEEWYYNDLESTIKQINSVLETTNFDEEELFYHPWW